MTFHARVAIGMPVLDRADYLEEAIESLLIQSYSDFAIVVVDDGSTDSTPDIVRRYAARDPRIRYERNPATVGMVENWRRTFRIAAEKVSGFEYFAFASDHDVWHPLWLESLVRELDADSGLVLAYPVTVPIRPDGKRIKSHRTRLRWETAGVADPAERVRLVAAGIPVRAGNIVYGLFRARALERCGVFPNVVGPDRLLMTQLALLGTFKQVPRALWMRRLWRNPRAEQRTRLFRRPPIHTYLPPGLVHAAMLFRWVVLAGGARPEVGRVQGVRIVGVYLRHVGLHALLRRQKSTRKPGKRESVFVEEVVRRSWRRAFRRARTLPRASAVVLRALRHAPRR
jgi:glycosyltransferase involved in cell wall biosynthesis